MVISTGRLDNTDLFRIPCSATRHYSLRSTIAILSAKTSVIREKQRAVEDSISTDAIGRSLSAAETVL